MKTYARMHVYRLQDGEVAATVVDAEGQLLDVKYFGKFTEPQYASLRRVIDRYEARHGKASSVPEPVQHDTRDPENSQNNHN
ncbi:MAG: hypothetical protein C0402_07655 [Thermodesulfovibrio sp.]|nr:hypothetical protein [Thermodesulfovibrio sp.]